MKELHEPPVSKKEYWDRYQASPHDHFEWYHERHFAKEKRRMQIVESVQAKLTKELGPEKLKKLSEELDDEAPIAAAMKRMPKAMPEDKKRVKAQEQVKQKKEKKHVWDGELHKKIRCESHICGGKGKPLDHPVHKLRDMSWDRKEEEWTESTWKDPDMTQEEWDAHRFIHGTAWSQAVLNANDQLAWHMQNPLLKKHTRDAWEQITGSSDLHEFFNEKHQEHSNFYEWIHGKVWDISDLPWLSRLKKEDPTRHDRPYYSDWLRTVRIEQRRNRQSGRKMLFYDIPTEEEHQALQRKLLETSGSLEEAMKHASWHRKTRELLERVKNDPEHEYHIETGRRLLDASEEVDEWEYVATMDGTQIPGSRTLLGGLPFAPNPFPNALNVTADAQQRQAQLQSQKTKPDASVPLFQLLAQTDCYTTTPKNPLCLPFIPGSWVVHKAPTIVWPANATATLDCSYLYCQPPRDASDWRAWIR
jgi:hypothetical protein